MAWQSRRPCGARGTNPAVERFEDRWTRGSQRQSPGVGPGRGVRPSVGWSHPVPEQECLAVTDALRLGAALIGHASMKFKPQQKHSCL